MHHNPKQAHTSICIVIDRSNDVSRNYLKTREETERKQMDAVTIGVQDDIVIHVLCKTVGSF